MKSSEAKKRFEKALDHLAYSKNLWDVFENFLDYSLLMLRWWDRKPEHFAELEKTYPTENEHKLFAEAFMCLGIMADNDGDGFKDPFGDYFMEHFSNDRRGQFFTPEPMCDLIAMMQIGPDLPDGAAVSDPACGSGRTLLSAAKINRKARFYASDVDITCCKMTVINFMLNCMPGEVAWMDTLTMDHWKSWHINLVMDGNGFYLPYYRVTGAGETYFIERLQSSIADMQEEKPDAPKTDKKGQFLLFNL